MDRAIHEWSGLFVYWITGWIAVPFPGPMSVNKGGVRVKQDLLRTRSGAEREGEPEG
jgi:hypothetical protein